MTKRLRSLAALGAIALGAASLVLPATTASAATGGVFHFVFNSTIDGGNGPGPIFFIGAITDSGTDIQGAKVDSIVFADGSFKADHNLPGGIFHATFDPRTCTGHVVGTGVPFVLKDGTGVYKGIHATGTADVRSTFVEARKANGKCSNGVFLAGSTQIQGDGTVTGV